MNKISFLLLFFLSVVFVDFGNAGAICSKIKELKDCFGGRPQSSAYHPLPSSPKHSSSSHSSEDEANTASSSPYPQPKHSSSSHSSEDEANMASSSSPPHHPHLSSDSEKEKKPKNDDEFEVTVEYVPDKHWNKYTITVKKTDTLSTLKDKIREKYTKDYNNEYGFGTIELVKEFLTDEREPFVMRNHVVLWHEDLDEYKTMEQCGIREGSMVSVFYARRLDKEEYDQGYYIRPWPTPKKIYF